MIENEVEFKDLPNKIKRKQEEKKLKKELVTSTPPNRNRPSLTDSGKKKNVNRKSTGGVTRKRKAVSTIHLADKYIYIYSCELKILILYWFVLF